MANVIAHFLSFIFKSKDLVTLNRLVALGTTGGQELFSLWAFQCPCEPVRNYRYGVMAICVPAWVFFFISIILNNQTWNVLDEFQCCRTKKCPSIHAFNLLYSIMGRALVAPVTWMVISLLRGEAYVCALSEFVDPSSLMAENESFPLSHATQILARFPCGESPDNLSGFREEVSRRLNSESQLLGGLLLFTAAMELLLIKCLKACMSKLDYHQEAYRAHYLANEDQLIRHTAEAHSLALAANNVKQFFGFVELSQSEEALMDKFSQQGTQLSLPWNRITGRSQNQEMVAIPLYSRLHEWTNRPSGIKKDFNMTPLLHPQPDLAASPPPDPCSTTLSPKPSALEEE